jgi:dephospho-CoA kinase
MRIGLTGGIGSGKSTVAAMLVAKGACLIDTDAIARALSGPGGAAMPALEAEFGAAIARADGGLDRDAMRRLAFADSSARRRLEAVLHPMIGEQALREAAAAGDHTVVFDVPLMTGSSAWRQRADRVLVIDCSEATQVARVVRRPGWTEETARQAIAAQASRPARRAMADAVIDNDHADLARLQQQIDALWSLWNNRP